MVFRRSRAEPRLLRFGQPLDLEPGAASQRYKWSMSIWARDLDTGKVKWIYQMTPHDEWDFDGVNEMILTDQAIGGTPRRLTHFDGTGFGYTLDRYDGRIAGRREIDPVVNWATKIDMDKSSKTYGRPLVVDADRRSTMVKTPTRRASARRRSAPRTNSRRPTARTCSCSTSPPTMSAWTMSPTRCPTPPGSGHARRAAVAMYPPKGDTHMGNFIAWDGKTGKIVWSNKEQFSAWGARSPRRATSCSTARSKAI